MMQDLLQETADGVVLTHVVENLKDFKKPNHAAAIWRRPEVPSFLTWIDNLSPNKLPSARLVLKPQNVTSALQQVFNEAATPDVPHRKNLIEDIAELGSVFSKVMRAPLVRIRLDRVTDNACRKFHIDSILARLVCTYRGTGTQYGMSADGGDPERVFTVPTGDPILMRGTRWPDKTTCNLLHRSPPIEGSKETRLVLVIDPIFDVD